MKIALIGYGKMGKVIEQIALERGHSVVAIYSSQNPIVSDELKQADIAIEFTNPDSVISNIQTCFECQVPVVVGSTGWNEELTSITTLCAKNNAALLHASNFSLGVNIFFKLNENLAKMMDKLPQYEPKITEIHHLQKLDQPSGTGITLAEGLLTNFNSKSTWINTPTNNKKELEIVSIREPNVPGTHAVSYQSAIDEIEIKHIAHSRNGFALGAVIAAEWLLNKKGVYTMQDVLNL